MTNQKSEPGWIVGQLRAWGAVEVESRLIAGDLARWRQAVIRAATDAGLRVLLLDSEHAILVVDIEH